MTNGNVLGFLAAPDRELSLRAVSIALAKVRGSGKTWKEIAKALECSTDALGTAVAEKSMLSFDSVSRLLYFWPDEAAPVRQLWERAETPLTVAERCERIERDLDAIRRAAA